MAAQLSHFSLFASAARVTFGSATLSALSVSNVPGVLVGGGGGCACGGTGGGRCGLHGVAGPGVGQSGEFGERGQMSRGEGRGAGMSMTRSFGSTSLISAGSSCTGCARGTCTIHGGGCQACARGDTCSLHGSQNLAPSPISRRGGGGMSLTGPMQQSPQGGVRSFGSVAWSGCKACEKGSCIIHSGRGGLRSSPPPPFSPPIGSRPFRTSTPVARGLEELVPVEPLNDDYVPPVYGTAWRMHHLRNKSFEDLHELWFVLAKERTRLLNEDAMFKARRRDMPMRHRVGAVKKSMARVKSLLVERAKGVEDEGVRRELIRMIKPPLK